MLSNLGLFCCQTCRAKEFFAHARKFRFFAQDVVGDHRTALHGDAQNRLKHDGWGRAKLASEAKQSSDEGPEPRLVIEASLRYSR